MLRVRRPHLALLFTLATQAMHLHQPRNTFLGAAVAQCLQCPLHAGAAITLFTRLMHLPNLRHQSQIGLCPLTGLAFTPRIVSTRRNV